MKLHYYSSGPFEQQAEMLAACTQLLAAPLIPSKVENTKGVKEPIPDAVFIHLLFVKFKLSVQ